MILILNLSHRNLLFLLLGLFNFLLCVPGATAASAASRVVSSPTTVVTIHAWPLDEASPVPMAVVEYKYGKNDDDDIVMGDIDANATLLSYTPPTIRSSSKNKKNKDKSKEGRPGADGSQDNDVATATRPLDLVRVGLYEGGRGSSGREWTGVVVGRSGLAGATGDTGDDNDDNDDREIKTTLVLHVNADGVWYGVGVGAERVKKKENDKNKKNKKGSKGGGTDETNKPNVVVEVSRQTPGPRPHLNKPVVLSPDGKKKMDGQEPEKTFLQKYWWAIALFLLVQVLAGSGGGGDGGGGGSGQK